MDEGAHDAEALGDYTSHNATRLTVEQVAELIEQLPEVRRVLSEVRAVSAPTTVAPPAA